MKLALALALVVAPALSLVVPPRRLRIHTRPTSAATMPRQRALTTSYGRANGSSDDDDDSRNDDDGRRLKFGFRPSKQTKNEDPSRERRRKKRHDAAAATNTTDNPLAMIYRLYVDYLRRLWSETDVDHRRSVARRRARDAITDVKDLVTGGGGDKHSGGEYDDADSIFASLDANVIQKMEEACTLMLAQLDAENVIINGGSIGSIGGGVERNDDDERSSIDVQKEATKIRDITAQILSTSSSSSTTTTTSPSPASTNDVVKNFNNLPVLNERGVLVSPAYDITLTTSIAAAAAATSNTTISTVNPSILSRRQPTASSVATDKTELTEALLAETFETAAVVIQHSGGASSSSATTTIISTTPSSSSSSSIIMNKKKKGGGGGGNSRSVLFGTTMGLVVAGWVYSGNYVFTALFTLMTALGQLEYYRMVMNTGIYPARKISVVGACAMFVTASFAPDLHQICLPVASTWAMIWFLTMRRTVSTISEIATTFTGIFYLGYIPSFWVRIRQMGADSVEPTRLAPLVRPILDGLGLQKNLPAFIPKTIKFPITIGANFIFWTWLCIAFSDVGGYFAGRRYGKTKLGAISPAAGKTSPNKTVEGVVGGCIISAILATLGAWVQQWPYWLVTGPIHGVLLALLGLVGDLTASMLKRDAGLKDFGDLIPEHGGIMDRVDSYIFTAPYGWIVCGYIIPWLRHVASGKASAAKMLVA